MLKATLMSSAILLFMLITGCNGKAIKNTNEKSTEQGTAIVKEKTQKEHTSSIKSAGRA